MKKSDNYLIKYMIELCEDINYLKDRFGNSYEDLITDKAYQLAVSMVIIDLGESANKLSEDYLEKHPQVPWRDIIGMRNIFAHNYMGINFIELWDTMEEDIPELHKMLERILEKEN